METQRRVEPITGSQTTDTRVMSSSCAEWSDAGTSKRTSLVCRSSPATRNGVYRMRSRVESPKSGINEGEGLSCAGGDARALASSQLLSLILGGPESAPGVVNRFGGRDCTDIPSSMRPAFEKPGKVQLRDRGLSAIEFLTQIRMKKVRRYDANVTVLFSICQIPGSSPRLSTFP